MKSRQGKPKGTHGGARPGSGKPLGKKWQSTLARETQRELYQQAILAKLQPLVTAQVELALGTLAAVTVVEVTDSGLKMRKVTHERELHEIIEAGRGHRIALVPPNVEMSKYITDQAIGKAPQPLTGPSGGPIPVSVTDHFHYKSEPPAPKHDVH